MAKGNRGGKVASGSAGEKLFRESMPENIIGRTNTADVLQRLDAYSRFARTKDENTQIWATELPEMYDAFAKNESEHNKLLDLVYSGKATESQRNRYSEVSDRRTGLGTYIRAGEKFLRDEGKFSLVDELEKKVKGHPEQGFILNTCIKQNDMLYWR